MPWISCWPMAKPRIDKATKARRNIIVDCEVQALKKLLQELLFVDVVWARFITRQTMQLHAEHSANVIQKPDIRPAPSRGSFAHRMSRTTRYC